MTYVQKRTPRFTRSQDGVISGVCSGIANQLGMDPGVVRLLWLLSVLVLEQGFFSMPSWQLCFQEKIEWLNMKSRSS